MLERRLRAEFEASGFEVVLADTAKAGPPRALEEAAARAGAAAAVRVTPSEGGGLEVWVADRITGKLLLREVVGGGGERPEPGMVALRAVELLRASLLELASRTPPRGPLPPPAKLRADVRRAVALDVAESSEGASPSPPERFAVGVGAAAGLGPGGVPPSADVAFSARWMALPRLGVRLVLLAPLAAPAVEGAEGSARVGVLVAGAGGHLELGSEGSALGASVGAGVGAVWARMDGEARAPFVSSSDDVLSALPYVELGARAELAARVGLRAGLLAGVAAPRPVVRFAGREVASVGRPLLVPSLMLEVATP